RRCRGRCSIASNRCRRLLTRRPLVPPRRPQARRRAFREVHLLHSRRSTIRTSRMRLTRGRRALRPLLVALLPLHAAAADQAADIAERAIRLDQTVQALKDEVVELTVEAQSIENTVLVPEHLRVSVYV